MVIKSLAHVCMKSNDLEMTEDFYCGVLGLKKLFDFRRHGNVIGFYMKTANETFIEVFHADEVTKIGKQYLNHFCLETDSLADLHRELVERGFEPGPIKMGADRTAQFWMRDPSGLEVEFQEYSNESAQRTGGSIEVDW